MTHNQDHTTSDGADDTGMVTLQVEIRAEHAALLRRFAGREGASIEALASLWLEEKLDEAMRSSNRPPTGRESGSGE